MNLNLEQTLNDSRRHFGRETTLNGSKHLTGGEVIEWEQTFKERRRY